MGVKFGSTNVVVLSSQSVLNEVFVKRGAHFSSRFPSPYFNQVFCNRGIFNADYDHRLKVQRKFVHQGLHRNLINNKNPEDRISEEIHYFLEELRSKNGKPFDLNRLFLLSVTNVICSTVVGKRFDYDDAWFKRIMGCVMESLKLAGPQFLLPVTLFPWVVHIPPFRRINKQFVESVTEFSALVQEAIDDHKASYDENNIRDLIDAFICEMKKENHHSSFDDLQLCILVRELLLAGNETTGTQLSWLIVAAMNYPEWHDKIHKEIIDLIGENGSLKLDHRRQLPLTCAFIQETLRLRPIGSLNAPHSASETVTVNGYTIPAGTMVLHNVFAVHTDPKVWKDPERFDPNRHINDSGNFVISNNLSAFSCGPRQCIGKTLAENKLFLYFGNICQYFRVKSDSSKPPAMSAANSGFVFSPKRHNVIVQSY
uniref:Uncharacterized protein n=1 Tax=Ciona savignyi TaxID=51511 RepID=H2YV99_CIOSA